MQDQKSQGRRSFKIDQEAKLTNFKLDVERAEGIEYVSKKMRSGQCNEVWMETLRRCGGASFERKPEWRTAFPHVND